MSRELPVRKNIRLKEYDYSSAGYYFVTMCVKGRHEMLGKIVGDATMCVKGRHEMLGKIVGDAPLRVPHCELSEYGIFVNEQIQKIDRIYPHVLVDKYVIMPNHVHMITVVQNRTSVAEDGTRRGASPTKATVPQIIQSLKSMTTKQSGFNMWQRSYHDHIIRDEIEYQRIWQYIDENPQKWMEDDHYVRPTAH